MLMNEAKMNARKQRIEARLRDEKRRALDEAAYHSAQSRTSGGPHRINDIPYTTFKG